MGVLRILVADDHTAVRRGIRSLVESHSQWEVCGEATDGQDAVEQASRLKPDVVLLDFTMPLVNGLEAARRIRREVPTAHVFVLTMHESDQLAEEARRAGAEGVVVKSEAHRSLIRAIESIGAPRPAIRLAGSVVGRQRHIGAFFQSAEESYRLLGPFIADGLAQNEKALHIINPPARELHVRRLMEAGIDVDRAEAQHNLELVSWEDAYLRGGKFDQRAMLALLRQLLLDGTEQGFPLTRVVAHMEWAAEDRPGVADIVEYEARLNFMLPDYDDVVICAYDMTKFHGDVIIGVMRSHPAVVIGGSLRNNPFYAPPDQMLEELGGRKAT